MRRLIAVLLSLFAIGLVFKTLPKANAASGINNGMSRVFNISLSSTPTPAPTATPGPTPYNTPTPAPTATPQTLSVAGSDTQVQYNNSGAFAGAAQLKYIIGTGETAFGTANKGLIFHDGTDAFYIKSILGPVAIVGPNPGSATIPALIFAGAGTNSTTGLSGAGSDIAFSSAGGINYAKIGSTSAGIYALGYAGATSGSSVANTTANSCGTTTATIAGGNVTGIVTVGATAGTSCTLTFSLAAANRRQCWCSNETTLANVCNTHYTDTTHTNLAGTFGGGDVINYGCLTY